MALRLVPIEDVKTWLGFTHTDDDVSLELLIRTLSARIEKFLARDLLKEAKVEVLDVGPRQQVFRLKAFPIDTSKTFTVKNDPAQEWTDTTEESSDTYIVAPNYGRLQFKFSSLIDGPQALQVSYTGGLAADTRSVPDDIQTATKMFIGEVWRRRKELSATSEGIGGFSVSMQKAVSMPQIVQEILWDHRAPWAKLGKPARSSR